MIIILPFVGWSVRGVVLCLVVRSECRVWKSLETLFSL